MIYPMILFLCAFFFYRYILEENCRMWQDGGAVLLIACIVIYIYSMLTHFREKLRWDIIERIFYTKYWTEYIEDRKMQKNNCANIKIC